MTYISKTALVPYSAADMYAIVADVESYPDFLSWCSSATIHSIENDTVIASIEIGYRGINKSFRTKNVNVANKKMTMSLLEGPFSKLEGVWQFDAIEDLGSKITMNLDFEFSNPILAATISPVFETIANSLVNDFTERAQQKLGKKIG